MCESALRIDQTARYRIRIQGDLDDAWSDRLSELTITHQHIVENRCVTALEGKVADQAALLGVLTALYDMRFPLLSVECLSCSPDG